MNPRIGFMGGMFDPVHCGHLQVARQVVRRLQLQRLHLIPCAVPNHRQGAVASAADRVAMLKLASQHDSQLLVDERELQRAGVSYTIDTVISLRAEFTDAALVMVQGMDSFASLPQWHRWREILQYCHLCVVSRPGSNNTPLSPELQTLLQERSCNDEAALFARAAGLVFVIDDLALDVASSGIRQLTADSRLNSGMLPAEVVDYIATHHLYLQEGLLEQSEQQEKEE
ncbi:MAG: nicotinate-nucleotide adenylyltransferase [Pseudomonadales bacterium]|nr:nicotinate-nucleotide adenylyltransferase [Pseudomonadales bacterium]